MARKAAAIQKKNSPALTIEQFKYVDDLGLSLPQLVLGIKIPRQKFGGDYPATDYNFKLGRSWLKIAHQTAGIACKQHYIVGTVLKPKSVSVAMSLSALDSRWYGSNVGALGCSLDNLIVYRSQLRELFNVDCNESHGDFEEGFAPIDVEFLPAMAADKLDPATLDDLIVWKSGWERSIGCLARWGLWVLCRNSD